MECGRPVMAQPGGSVTEVVRDGVSGWMCRDVDDMAARMVSPGATPASCRSWVEGRFSVDRMAARYVDLYERLAAQPPRVEHIGVPRRLRDGASDSVGRPPPSRRGAPLGDRIQVPDQFFHPSPAPR